MKGTPKVHEPKRDSSTDLPGSTHRRLGSPFLWADVPQNGTKPRASGHFAQNDGAPLATVVAVGLASLPLRTAGIAVPAAAGGEC